MYGLLDQAAKITQDNPEFEALAVLEAAGWE